jgi:hypothetical protein
VGNCEQPCFAWATPEIQFATSRFAPLQDTFPSFTGSHSAAAAATVGLMNLPISLPDWLPWWVPIVVLVPALFYLLVFLLMPFSVMGLKGRLEAIDARMDEIQGEIRNLVLRLPEPVRGTLYDEAPYPPARSGRSEIPARPPIPPAPHHPEPAEQDNQPSRLRRDAPPQRDGYRRDASLRAEPMDDDGRYDDPTPDAYHRDSLDSGRNARQRDTRREPPRRSEPRLEWPR